MKWLLRKCPTCKSYTLKLKCPKCGAETILPHPPKFSPHDKYARLRQPERHETDQKIAG